MADETTGNDLVEEIEVEVQDAGLISYAVDSNLTVAGAAADAKAVGDRFAEDEAKTAEDILYAAGGETTIKDIVDDLADNTGEDIAVSSTDNTSIATKIGTIEASLYGTQIPVSSAAGAGSVADALTAQAAKTGNELLYSSGGSTIKTVVDGINSRLTTAESTLSGVSSAVSGMNAVKYTEQTLTAAQQTQARANIGAVAPAEAVSVDAQTLTTSQKSQARSNIGAISADDAVSVNSQSLTDTQKAQARTNIAALSAADVSDVVRVSEQSFTVAQQTQARTNIDAAKSDIVNGILRISSHSYTLPSDVQPSGTVEITQTELNVEPIDGYTLLGAIQYSMEHKGFSLTSSAASAGGNVYFTITNRLTSSAGGNTKFNVVLLWCKNAARA